MKYFFLIDENNFKIAFDFPDSWTPANWHTLSPTKRGAAAFLLQPWRRCHLEERRPFSGVFFFDSKVPLFGCSLLLLSHSLHHAFGAIHSESLKGSGGRKKRRYAKFGRCLAAAYRPQAGTASRPKKRDTRKRE